MMANELANKLKCHIMRHGDCVVLIDGKDIEDTFWLRDPSCKRDIVEIRPIKKVKRGKK